MSAVRRAIRDGILAHPTTSACVDCGQGAEQYDHRDYNQPLAVDPVCRGCNARRGPAIPLRGSVEMLLSRGCIPYRSATRLSRLCALMGRAEVAARVPKRRLTLDDWSHIWPELNVAAPKPAAMRAKAKKAAA